jgi:hypothetical protein
LSHFNEISVCSADFPKKKNQISSLIKIRSVGAGLFHAGGRTDMTKLIDAFRNFANAPKNCNNYAENIRRPWFVQAWLVKGKGNGYPLQASSVSWGFRRLRLWIFSTFVTMKVVKLSPLRTGRLHPQEFSWYSFLEAASTPGHMELSKLPEKIPSEQAWLVQCIITRASLSTTPSRNTGEWGEVHTSASSP